MEFPLVWYLCTCIYVCIHTHLYVRMSVCMYVYVYVCVSQPMYVCMYVYMCMYVCVCVCVYGASVPLHAYSWAFGFYEAPISNTHVYSLRIYMSPRQVCTCTNTVRACIYAGRHSKCWSESLYVYTCIYLCMHTYMYIYI